MSHQQQQRSHIPKFGSWDADNVPITAYFDNARKDKGTGIMINPNDPEENPEAFMNYGGGNEDVSNDDIVYVEKNVSSWRKKSTTSSEVSSDKGSVSDVSSKQQSHKSDRKRNSNTRERTSNFSPPAPANAPVPNRPKYGYNPVDDLASHRSVPVFGAWDDKDPTSGDGFTVIFQKVKEEKHIAATKFPPIPQHKPNMPKAPKNDHKSVKKWCCLY